MFITSNSTLLAATNFAALTDLTIPMSNIDLGSLQIVYAAKSMSTKTFTDTNVNTTTDVVTVTAHGYSTGLKVALTTSGTLPIGLSATNYYMIVVDANKLKFATSATNALAGTAVDITAVGGIGDTQTLTPASLGAVIFTIQVSNDGTNWFSTSLTKTYASDGTHCFDLTTLYYKYYRLETTIAAGCMQLSAILFGKNYDNV